MSKRSPKGKARRQSLQSGTAAKDLPAVSFATTRAWSEWLEAHHASSRGLWLKIAKKGSKSTSTSLTYPAALDVALAWGWIDGQKNKFDDAWWLQRFTPR